MKKFGLAAAALAAALYAVPAAAITITFDDMAAGDGSVLTTPVAGATVIDFNGGSKPGNYSGDGGVVTGSLSGHYAAPAVSPDTDTTPYLSVALQSPGGTETISVSLADNYNYFGLFWGSIDAYNTLEFYRNGGLVATITGADVINGTFGDQTSAGSNRYVNIYLGAAYDEVRLSTTQYAFESDNHAFAQVPEPATLGLMGLGLLGLGVARRRRS